MPMLYTKILLLILIISAFFYTPLAAENRLVDFVVATVDGTPITLSEVARRAGIQKPTSLKEASRNSLVQAALEELIVEYLLKSAAQRERITTSETEVERYIEQVAAQNGMNSKEFVAALQSEGKSLESYKKQIEIEILRSKIAGSMLRDGISVSEEDVDSYIKEYPFKEPTGNSIKLRQILLDSDKYSKEAAEEKLLELKESIRSVRDFSEAAQKLSDGPESYDGGLLGVVTEKDLSEQIFKALYNLDKGKVSNIIESPMGYHLFMIEDRYSSSKKNTRESEKNYRAEVRKQLEQRKLEERMHTFFSQELLDKFAVEKKI
jgi:peptidyl-prolyl cis-trans isomerase SurA